MQVRVHHGDQAEAVEKSACRPPSAVAQSRRDEPLESALGTGWATADLGPLLSEVEASVYIRVTGADFQVLPRRKRLFLTVQSCFLFP